MADLTSRQCRSKQAQADRSENICEFPHGENDVTIACRSTAGIVSGHCPYISLLYPVKLLYLHGSAATWRDCVSTRVSSRSTVPWRSQKQPVPLLGRQRRHLYQQSGWPESSPSRQGIKCDQESAASILVLDSESVWTMVIYWFCCVPA